MVDLLGTDLAVTPLFVAHDASQVDLVRKSKPGPGRVAVSADVPVDLDTLSGRQNLAQALLLRLLTPLGSLASLGHAKYGSRLHELIGKRKTEELRNLCRAFVLEVVAQEPRVDPRAVALTFDPLQETFDSFVFTVAVKPVDADSPLVVALVFNI
jgi:phage baseplate assembly protein W